MDGGHIAPAFTRIIITKFLMITRFVRNMQAVSRCLSCMAAITGLRDKPVRLRAGIGFQTNAAQSNGENIMGRGSGSSRSNKGGGGGGGATGGKFTAEEQATISRTVTGLNTLSPEDKARQIKLADERSRRELQDALTARDKMQKNYDNFMERNPGSPASRNFWKDELAKAEEKYAKKRRQFNLVKEAIKQAQPA